MNISGSKRLCSGRLSIFSITTMIFLFIAALLLVFLNYGCSAEDPHWSDTHIEAASIQQAISIFGSDLLIDKMIYQENEEKCTFNAVLELLPDGQVESRETWSMLTANYDYDVNDSTISHRITTTVFFDKNHHSIHGDDEEVGYDNVFDGSEKTAYIGSTEVFFKEYMTSGYQYSCIAKFTYNDYVYYVDSKSSDGDIDILMILEQMLNP